MRHVVCKCVRGWRCGRYDSKKSFFMSRMKFFDSMSVKAEKKSFEDEKKAHQSDEFLIR